MGPPPTDEPPHNRPQIVLVRHGETEWTRSGQHTSRTNIPLTAEGRREAERLRPMLATQRSARVLTSPLERAAETCRLSGFGTAAEVEEDLTEWDYGAYEGRTTSDIRADVPGWSLWRDGAPDGESPSDVATRVDRVLEEIRRADQDTLVFSHGHLLRVLAARWLGLMPDAGRLFALAPASVSVLGWEREQPVLLRWNHVLE
jgi:broad specificity phosphatase PhoE